ncbi:MAG: universal stress protein, partial [Solirubrobacterales bacterium]|nr:universal stress protein [Solirubrobacterales bacterium]
MSSRAISTRDRGGSGANRSPLARIGVGFDGGPSGRDAVILASLLASVTHADLMLIAGVEEPIVATVAPAGMDAISVRRQTQAMLAATKDSLVPGARTVVHLDAHVRRGLRHVARREHCDLLVVGSDRRARAGRTALGERSQEVLCHLACPLAIAPSGMADGDSLALERIGTGFDGKAESRVALELAGSIAVAAKAE